MDSIRAAWDVWQNYDLDALAPLTAEQWDAYSSRAFRYHFYRLYYSNVVYTELERNRLQHLKKSMNGLYRFTRGIYNPAARAINLYPGKIYGGQLDMDTLTTGAIPIMDADNKQRNAIRQLWRWSNWNTEKSNLVKTGTQLGDVFIKMIDEPDKSRVRMEVQIPDIYKELDFSGTGSINAYVIEYERFDKEEKKSYIYREVGNKEFTETFKDNKPFPYLLDAAGNPVSKWKNIYTFVPVIHIPHEKVVGSHFGMSVIHKVLGKIDEMNSAASSVNDNIKKVNNPVWHAKGVTGEITGEMNDDKGKMSFIKTSKDVELTALVQQIDIAAAVSNIDKMEMEIERDMPELSLHRIREGGNLTAPGVRAAYSDAIDLIREAAGLYDAGLIRAHQMAMTIGGIRGYPEFGGFTLESYNNGDLDHMIAPREIIEDELTKSERLAFLLQAQSIENMADKKLILRELGFSDEELDIIQAEVQEEDAQLIQRRLIEQEQQRTNALVNLGQGLQANNVANTNRQPQPA